jgi:hypothetical protein
MFSLGCVPGPSEDESGTTALVTDNVLFDFLFIVPIGWIADPSPPPYKWMPLTTLLSHIHGNSNVCITVGSLSRPMLF